MPARSKELVRALLSGKQVSRPPFIPYLAAAAARFMQVPVRQMFSDPTTLANSLQSCQRLFKYDGVVVLFDSTLEAEACGCRLQWQEGEPPSVVSPALKGLDDLEALDISGIGNNGRMPVVLEAAKRLSQTVGREVAMLGVVTGPVTLSRHLMGEAFISADADSPVFQKAIDASGKIALTMARAFGELNFDAVVLSDEDLASLEPDRYSSIQPVLRTLRNVLGFYDAPLIIQSSSIPAENLHDFFQLEVDGFSLGNPVSDIATSSSRAGAVRGGCIPASALLGSTEDVELAMSELLNSGGKAGFFVATEGEVPAATPAPNLHKVMQVLNAAG